MQKTIVTQQLRQTFPVFEYSSYSVSVKQHSDGRDLQIQSNYTVGEHNFTHTITLHNVPGSIDEHDPILHNFAFSIGMVESLNYWKLSCSPQILVKAGYLDQTQLAYWHDLFIQGMGEYFYLNQIDFTQDDFLTIVANNNSNAVNPKQTVVQKTQQTTTHIKTEHTILVPVGGGKDSATSLYLLQQAGFTTRTIMVNANQAALRCAAISGDTNPILITRTLDPRMLGMNTEGTFLNGHVPISAMLAYELSLAGYLFGYQYLANSCERSSNEATAYYKNQPINHQYSKSYDFEQKFQSYVADYIYPDETQTHYFSLLRPWHEIQIAAAFSKADAYHAAFLSCNRGQREDRWCHACPKCLFVYCMLFPFIDTDTLDKKIFKHSLFEDSDLTATALQMIGAGEHKPFECVGSISESNIACFRAIEAYQQENKELPVLLASIADTVLADGQALKTESEHILSAWNPEHSIPEFLLPCLTSQELHWK